MTHSAVFPASAPRQRWADPAALLLLLLLALVLQLAMGLLSQNTGVSGKDFSSHPDEAAHVVTGLMVADYGTAGLMEGKKPMSFAKDYYDRLPRVALGHYPPMYYVVEGAWLAVWRSPSAALVLPGVIGGLWAWVIYLTGKPLIRSRIGAFAAAATVLLLPAVQRDVLGMVMSDGLLAVFCLLAVRSLAGYFERGTAKASLAFGVWAAFAGLTKGSGFLLAVAPPVAIALLGEWRRLRDWRLWISAVPVALTALPWTILTRKIAEEGMRGTTRSEHIREAVPFYAGVLVEVFGWILLTLTIVAVVHFLWKRVRSSEPPNVRMACLISLPLATLALYLVTPIGLEIRYMLPIAPIVLLATLPLVDFAAGLGWSTRKSGAVAGGVLLLAVSAEKVRPIRVAGSGYDRSASVVMSLRGGEAAGPPADVLISSDAPGEGAFIAAMAFRESPHGVVRVLRSSKVLSTSDWMGRGYQQTHPDTASLLRFLTSGKIGWIVTDSAASPRYRKPHHDQLDAALRENPALFPVADSEAVVRPDGTRGTVTVHRVVPAAAPLPTPP